MTYAANRWSSWRLGCGAAALLGLAGGGCIPVYRSTVLRPAGVIAVRDTTTSAPIGHARVLVRRFNLGPPPRRQSHLYADFTASDGRASFTLLKSHEWAMPLMMHGVTQWAFDVCVDAPGHQERTERWLVQGMWTEDKDRAPQPDLVVTLTPGEGSCDTNKDWQSLSPSQTASPP